MTLLLVLKITQLQNKYWYDISLRYIANYVQEEFEDTKGVIIIRKPMDREHNGQERKVQTSIYKTQHRKQKCFNTFGISAQDINIYRFY